MSVTDRQKQLVTETFARVGPISDEAASMFYSRLWEIAPETKSLFSSTDMRQQGMKLIQTIGIAVKSLDNLDSIVPVVRDLGRRHIAYGVTREQYTIVGEALLWTLEQALGADFTPEVRDAWASVYGVLSSVATSAYELEGS